MSCRCGHPATIHNCFGECLDSNCNCNHYVSINEPLSCPHCSKHILVRGNTIKAVYPSVIIDNIGDIICQESE